ncbi:BRCT domain-containing protein [Phaeobacter sp. JH20_32]|uniref:BRCT domain-containing protein n=2 Tax=Phaeobacter TaxID=302485 RepID=UPI003A84811B
MNISAQRCARGFDNPRENRKVGAIWNQWRVFMEVVIESASSGNRYKIIIQQENDGISLSCNCPAGTSGGFCKHRFALIGGDTKAVVEANGDVKAIPGMVQGTELEAVINRMHDQERAINDAQAKLKKIKKMVGRVMLGSQHRPSEAEITPSRRNDDLDPEDTRALAGLTVVFSGTFDKFTRSEAKQLAEDHGARVAGSISTISDFFVCGTGAESKQAKARDKGIRTISETEFLELIS